MSLVAIVRKAWPARQHDAELALQIFRGQCEGRALPRVPGMDTVLRLAVRLEHGKSIEEAAAREYVYRWHLALTPSPRNAEIFGVPHTLGM